MKKLDNESVRQLAKQAAAVVAVRLPACYVYEVTSRREGEGWHLTLLVVLPEPTVLQPFELACEIGQKVPGLSVSLLLHTLKQLGTREADRRRFFHQVVSGGELLHAGLPAAPFVVPLPDDDGAGAARFAFDRLALAEVLLQSARRRGGDFNVVGLSELRQVVTLSALAMLRVKVGYVPANHDIGLLLHLCEYVRPCREAVFSLSTKTGAKVMKSLSVGPQTLRHAAVLSIPARDYDEVLRVVFSFNTLAVHVVADNLDKRKSHFNFPAYGHYSFA